MFINLKAIKKIKIKGVYFFCIIIGGLLLLNMLLLIKNQTINTDFNYKMHLIEEQKNQIDLLERIISFSFEKDIYSSVRDSALNTNGELNRYLSTGDKIVCFMQKGVCSSCIFAILQDLAIAEQKIGKGNIIVLSNIGTKEHPIGMKEYDFPTIYIETFYFPKEYSTEPIIFIIDEDLNVKLLYTPNLLPQFRNKFFEKYLPTYFRNQQSGAK